MRSRALSLVTLLTILVAATVVASCGGSDHEGSVHVIKADGEINPIMKLYIDRALEGAERDHARLAIIELDTPGGFSSSMREIVQRIERAKVPVAVYVSPAGGRAASAGTFITLAGHIAAMAPNTSIGAASAINSDGSDIKGTLGRKVENDAVAFIRGIAELRGRNADWAESAVRDAVAVSQSRAVELHVVDFEAANVDDLLRQATGRTVTLGDGTQLTLTGLDAAPRVNTGMTIWERFLGILSDPTIASLLLTVGFIGILIEMSAPGISIPGITGVICIALAFLGFGVLPVDLVGIALIVIGLGLIGTELFVPHGFLGVGGAIAIVLGGIIAFRGTPADLRPPLALLITLGLVFALIAVGVIAIAFTARRGHRAEDGRRFIGKTGVVRSPLAPEGTILIRGERWQAQLESGTAAIGEKVRVTGADGFRLQVRPEKPAPQP